jgi:putative NADH-flavin reductase
MKMVLIGVTGPSGRSLLEQTLANGHKVTAIARDPAKITVRHPNLLTLKGDVFSAPSLVEGFADNDLIISCVGVSNPMQARRGTTVYSAGTRNIVEAMHQTHIKRIIAVSSAGVAPRKGAPIIYKLIVKPFFLEPAYRDMRLMESFLSNTELNWTLVRPPLLTADPLHSDYRLMPDHNFDDDRPLPRASLAHFLVNEAESPHFIKRVVAISG